ncbi:E3 SUMO-protein ligase ZBED1-like [Ostrea edulis]|uniref:E3 SUMO-protein ligase ZBED1-like n=1 Tax=Ostrea edulis TaxID=37623 RepID=UPI0024B00078|nr:E3 SUMO-protein ligase ZBED1-like [Ostrea edulis]
MELSHTSENIANSLQKTQLQWKLPQPIATSDNAANEVKAYENLGWSRFGCYGHRINLIVKHSLLVKEVDRILGKSRKLATFFHKSSSVTEMLLSKQKLLLNQEQVGHKLIIDVATRWNSTLYMLQRLVEQTPVLMALANDPDLSKTASNTLKNCVFSFQELSIVEKFVKLLSPFEKATTILCADKYPTMHKVLPVITKLLRIVELNDEDLPVIKHIKQQMQLEMDKRAVSEDISVIACMMNPFTKDLNFAPNDRDRARMLLREMVSVLDVNPVQVKQEKVDDKIVPALPSLPSMNSQPEEQVSPDGGSEPDTQPRKTKKLKSADTDDWLDDIVITGETKEPTENIAYLEVERFFGSKLIDEDQNLTVLEWWKKNEIFPRIALIAKKYLCVPASSVSSERVFSLAGEIVNKKPNRLHHSHVGLLIFFNKNFKYW